MDLGRAAAIFAMPNKYTQNNQVQFNETILSNDSNTANTSEIYVMIQPKKKTFLFQN